MDTENELAMDGNDTPSWRWRSDAYGWTRGVGFDSRSGELLQKALQQFCGMQFLANQFWSKALVQGWLSGFQNLWPTVRLS